MSEPEGATHYSESFDRWYKLDVSGEWFFWLSCERWESSNDLNGGDCVPDLTSLRPTLETMLTEWRDLEARAQAAQAEADALFEHAGQCHGEIVVRLAELGWGAPRGKPVVTLDNELPTNVTRYDLRVGDVIQLIGCKSNDAWKRFAGLHVTICELPAKVEHPTLNTWLLCDDTEFVFISRPSTQP